MPASQECQATPHCPVLPAGHDLLTWAPLGRTRNREPVLRLRQASSNSCSDCARSVRLGFPVQFLPGAGTHESPSRPGQNQGNYGAGGADFSCSSRYSRSFFTRCSMAVLLLQLVASFLEADQMTFR